MAAELKTSVREWLPRLVTWVPGSIHTKLLAAFLAMVVLFRTAIRREPCC